MTVPFVPCVTCIGMQVIPIFMQLETSTVNFGAKLANSIQSRRISGDQFVRNT